jgi:hypothetical protein
MRPPVTPIFPRSNGPIVPENLPIRKTDPREQWSGEVAHGVRNYQYSKSSNNNQPEPIISCISIAQHIDSCPICSRLYDTDKTLYILAIIGLLVLCFLMVKRIVKL